MGICIYKYIYIYMNVCMYIYVYMYTYICIYTYICVSLREQSQIMNLNDYVIKTLSEESMVRMPLQRSCGYVYIHLQRSGGYVYMHLHGSMLSHVYTGICNYVVCRHLSEKAQEA